MAQKLDLTACSLIVFAELHWNAALMAKAEACIHQPDTPNCPTVQYLVGEDTLDSLLMANINESLKGTNQTHKIQDFLSEESSLTSTNTDQKPT